MSPPIPMRWTGDSFAPSSSRWAKEADRRYVVGQVYPVEIVEPRSTATHNHFFSIVNAVWESLPEDQAERFPSAEHLRKWALIQSGYADERSFVASSKAEALRLAAFLKPIDEYAVVTVRDVVVRVFTAQSQSMKAMGAKEFAKSKERVLNVLSRLIGTDPATLGKAVAA